MASYTILTTRKQEAGLTYAYDTFADKTVYPTQAAYFQARINHQVTNPMYEQQQQAQAVLFEESFDTIPESEQPAARTEIEAVITAHGGEIIHPTPSPGPFLTAKESEP